MIHVCFGLHDKTGRYSKFTGTTILSIFENTTSDVTAHILHDNTLSTDNRDKFIYLAGRYGQTVKFYNVDELCADKIAEIKNLVPAIVTNKRFTIATMYRLLIPQIFSADIERIIYLDSDIVVNLDIKEFWQIELGDKIFAAANEVVINSFDHPKNVAKKYLTRSGLVGYDDYFNAGVLLLNLKIFRTESDLITNGLKFLNENPQITLFDQDILNYLYSKNYLKLPERFNSFINKTRRVSKTTNRNIYHFVGSTLKMEMSDPFNRLWMKYFIRTPWFDVDTIGRIYNGFRQMHVELKQSMANVSAMMSGKTRAFFTAPQSVDAIKKIFSVRADEEIILAENQTSLKKLIDSMNASRGRKLFFIILQGFPFQILNQLGFVAGRDFVNGMDFLSEAQGVSFNSHPLIKAM